MSDPLAPAMRLRALLGAEGCRRMPCCFDGLSARLVARAALPDTGLLHRQRDARRGPRHL
jgi:hypothetical protein